MLSIKQFVEESLVQIAEGIQGAQERVRDTGARFAPDVYSDSGKESGIEFDLAVTVAQGTETGETAEGRIGVIAAVFGAAAGVKTRSGKKEENFAVSRIRFTVQARLPAAHQGEKSPDFGPLPPAGGM